MKISSRRRHLLSFFPAQTARLGLACVAVLCTLPTGAWGQAPGTVTATPAPTVSGLDQIILHGAYEQAASDRLNERVQRLWIDELTRTPADGGRSAIIPPFLPVLMEPVSAGIATDASPRYQAKLAACAGDTYFMAYTSLLRQDAWSDRRSKRLEASLAVRKKLLEEIRAKLANADGLPADRQLALLADFARTQAPELQALEAEDESIRLDLTTRTAFRRYEDGVRLPISATTGPELPPVALVLLFSVQFDPGLTAAQRELLQGVVQELGASDTEIGTSFSFWPARARLPLPAGLSADLRARLQEVQQMKQQLVLEVLEVLKGERDETRTAALAALASRQAPAFAALDALADELRPQLAALYAPPSPSTVDAPPALLHQVERAFARKAALQHRVNTEIRELRRLLPNDRIELVQQNQTPVIVHSPGKPSDQARVLTAAEEHALRDRLEAINAELAQRTQALITESQALQAAVRDYRDKILQAPQQNLGQLASSLVQAVTAQENERLYRDYRAAVLQSGLSLEQRRLLLRETLAEIERTRLRNPWAD